MTHAASLFPRLNHNTGCAMPQELDVDGDGTVSLLEWREVLATRPILFETFFGKCTSKALVRRAR